MTTSPSESAAPKRDDAVATERARLVHLLEDIRPELQLVDAALARVLDPPAGYVRNLVEHVQGFQGKRLRPAMVILAGQAVNASRVGETHATVGAIVELIHTATLVHDDILDGAMIRRMRPTVHSMEGVEVSVLFGDFLLASAYAEAAALEDRRASHHLSLITRDVCEGEILQIHHRGNLDLTYDEYLRIIQRKTAALYAASGEMGAHYAGGTQEQIEALRDYGDDLGTAFQMIDDVLDLTGDEDVVGKSLGTDLGRCKMTLPLIHFFQEGPRDVVQRVRDALRSERGREEGPMIRRAVVENGSVAFAEKRAHDLIRRAMSRLEVLPESPARDTLHRIATYVLERKK